MVKASKTKPTAEQNRLLAWKRAWQDLIELASKQPGGADILNGMYCGLSGGLLVDEKGLDIFNREKASKETKELNKRFLGLLEADADIDDDDEEDDEDLDDVDQPECELCDDPDCNAGDICQVEEKKKVYTVRYKQRSFGKGWKAKSMKVGKWFCKAENKKEAERRFGQLKLAHSGIVSIEKATKEEIAQYEDIV